MATAYSISDARRNPFAHALLPFPGLIILYLVSPEL